MHTKKTFDRRRFLRGLGGVTVGLPALDLFQTHALAAAAPARKIYSAMMLQQNGSIQGNGGDPDMFWPRALGPIDAAAMAGADADRATSELKDYASKLIFARGMNFRYSNNHDGGPVAAGTGAPVTGSGVNMLPVSESADYFIAKNLTPGIEPLTLYAGRKGTFRDDAFSFATGGKLRVGDNNPWNVYQRLMGLAAVQQTDPGLYQKIAARRLSINDLIRGDLKGLLARTDLSAADRERLDLHLTSVRDLEQNMTKTMGPLVDSAAMKAVNGEHTADNNMESVVKMQLDLIAFAFASDRVRSATLQVGGCNDHTKYTINGVQQPPYHFISHRVMSDGGGGDKIADAVTLHHEIDRIHARYFKHLLDQLSAYTLPDGGTLLDSSANLWVNSVADGPPHSGKNVPHILAGGAGGFWKTGVHLKTTGYTSKVLSTLVSAAGVRKANGDLVDNFGDPSSTGILSDVIA
jgi:Protein of unknown function (DUF1552)